MPATLQPQPEGATSTDFFHPTQFIYDEATDAIRCPAGETLKPSGKHARDPIPNIHLQGLSAEAPMHARRPEDNPSALRAGTVGLKPEPGPDRTDRRGRRASNPG
jgi:hypothetical protein